MCVCVSRAALLSVLKVLKLLLIASGYATVCQMVIDMKQEGGKISEDKKGAAKVLQSALEQIIAPAEMKLKNVGINMAKLYVDKVPVLLENRFSLCVLILEGVGGFPLGPYWSLLWFPKLEIYLIYFGRYEIFVLVQ